MEGRFMDTTKTKKIPQMPAPPDFLLRKTVEEATQKIAENQPSPKPENAPRSVDYLLYHTAIEERKIAEVRSAEIYSKYLEMTAFSEKLIKKINHFEVYKVRVRDVYNRALLVDEITLDNLKLSRRDLDNTQKMINGLNLENQSLQASIEAHQEAFGQMSKQLGQAEAAMEYANEQFQLLAAEYENRGDQVKDLEKRLKGASIQINEISDKYRESIKRADYLHDQNLLISNELRETQLKESAIATLNEDLTHSIPKLQKQIHLLEEKLRMEREEFDKKVLSQQNEMDRLKENRLVDALVEKSKKTVGTPVLPPQSLGQKVEEKIANKEKWNEFYSRWSQIIGELSSHSAPLRPSKEEQETQLTSIEQLISEKGDVDWV